MQGKNTKDVYFREKKVAFWVTFVSRRRVVSEYLHNRKAELKRRGGCWTWARLVKIPFWDWCDKNTFQSFYFGFPNVTQRSRFRTFFSHCFSSNWHLFQCWYRFVWYSVDAASFESSYRGWPSPVASMAQKYHCWPSTPRPRVRESSIALYVVVWFMVERLILNLCVFVASNRNYHFAMITLQGCQIIKI